MIGNPEAKVEPEKLMIDLEGINDSAVRRLAKGLDQPLTLRLPHTAPSHYLLDQLDPNWGGSVCPGLETTARVTL